MMVKRVLCVPALLLAGVAVACGGRSHPPQPAISADEHAKKVQAWRDKHEEDYRRDWVSVAGLYFLEPGSHTVGSAKNNDIVITANVPATIGRVELSNGAIRFLPARGVPVMQKGQPIKATVVLKETAKPPAGEVTIGDVRLVAHVSGDRPALRVRDPNGAVAKGFTGFTWFPIDLAYRVTGRFIKDDEPRKLTVVNTLNDADTYTSQGVVEFELQGRTLRLRPFTTRPNRLYFVFRDASSGEETYQTARFLYSDLLPDGTTVLDFNEAYNPPCAFNPFTTCPIPLKENILPVKILAGEKAYKPN